MGEKKKKEKVKYVDDGRPLADMSAVTGGFRLSRNHSHTRFKDAWHTYWKAVKMMLLPMFAVIGALVVIYVIMYILFAYIA